MIHSRQDLSMAHRVVIKAGANIVSTPRGYPSLSRIASIVEQAAELVQQGKEVIIVTSGAVGMCCIMPACGYSADRHRQTEAAPSLVDEAINERSSRSKQVTSHVHCLFFDGNSSSLSLLAGKQSYNSACAAAGQLGLMSLYETMFDQYDILASQMLLTSQDFDSHDRRRNIQVSVSRYLLISFTLCSMCCPNCSHWALFPSSTRTMLYPTIRGTDTSY